MAVLLRLGIALQLLSKNQPELQKIWRALSRQSPYKWRFYQKGMLHEYDVISTVDSMTPPNIFSVVSPAEAFQRMEQRIGAPYYAGGYQAEINSVASDLRSNISYLGVGCEMLSYRAAALSLAIRLDIKTRPTTFKAMVQDNIWPRRHTVRVDRWLSYDVTIDRSDHKGLARYYTTCRIRVPMSTINRDGVTVYVGHFEAEIYANAFRRLDKSLRRLSAACRLMAYHL